MNFYGFTLTLEMLDVKFLRHLSFTSHIPENNYMYVCMYMYPQ